MNMVRLTSTELMISSYVGAGRNVQSTVRQSKPGHGAGNGDSWTWNIEGAQGEAAVAKFLATYWLPIIGDTKADDVGPYQVRTNCSRKWDDTILNPDDPDDRVFIGVLSFMPEFEIMGWIWGHEGKQEKWFRVGTPGRPKTFWVPRSALHPMSELPTIEQLQQGFF